MNALGFEAAAPTAGVLTGFLLPSTGPLTAWAPVWATLQADGSLREAQTGGWIGPRPEKWLKVVKPGFVVGGLRVLVRTGPGSLQIRQVQVFWKSWAEGGPRGPLVTSRVYGQAATATDDVKIIELTSPEGAVPSGFWGETLGSQVVQVSLMVKTAPPPASTPPAPGLAPASTQGPTAPQVPEVSLTKPATP